MARMHYQEFLLDPFDKCQIETEAFQVDDKIKIKFSSYSSSKEVKKSILILPPTGGKNILDRAYANLFCKAGYNAYILEDWTGLNGGGIDLDLHQRYQTHFQKSVAFLIDKIKARIGGEKLGVLGASAGAINFSVTLSIPSVIKKVDAFMGIVTGGPLCKVIAYAGEQGLEGLRQQRMKAFNISSLQEYEDAICSHLDWNVATQKPEHLKLGLIVSLKDKTVLTKFQQKQAQDLQPDFHKTINSNHLNTVIKSYLFNRGKIKCFFDQALEG